MPRWRGFVDEIGVGGLGKLITNGQSFNVRNSFSGGATDGAQPIGGLAVVGGTLFGMTASGGANNGGTIFALAVPEPGSFALAAMAMLGFALWNRRRKPNVSRARALGD